MNLRYFIQHLMLFYASLAMAQEGIYNVAVSSYIGSDMRDEVRGCVLLPNGDAILAVNFNGVPDTLNPEFLFGTDETDRGYLLLFSEGAIIKSIVVGDKIGDLSSDALGNIYAAAGNMGLVAVDNSLESVIFRKELSDRAHRVDASPSGDVAVLIASNTDYDEVKLRDARIDLYTSSGTSVISRNAGLSYTTDIALDEENSLVITVGFKNINSDTPQGEFFPVDVPQVKGISYDGTTSYFMYNWDGDENSASYLNSVQNNMADTRAGRVTIGDDGLLYIAFEVDGGNHILRYHPFVNDSTTTIVKGDDYSNFFNTKTEPKLVVGRYDPATGECIRMQQFCARLSNGAGNTVRIKNGDIAANAEGEVYVVGESFSGIPIISDQDLLPDFYRGGSYLLKFSADFSERQIMTRFTRGGTKCIDLGSDESFVIGGESRIESMYLQNELQSTLRGETDGWFAISPSSCSALTGTYEVDGGSNEVGVFSNLAEAIESLYTCGISGPTTLTLVPGSGPYEEEIIINAFPGSKEFGITIDGNGEALSTAGSVLFQIRSGVVVRIVNVVLE